MPGYYHPAALRQSAIPQTRTLRRARPSGRAPIDLVGDQVTRLISNPFAKSSVQFVNPIAFFTNSIIEFTKSAFELTNSINEIVNSVIEITRSATLLTRSVSDLTKSLTGITRSFADLAKSAIEITKSVSDLTKSEFEFLGFETKNVLLVDKISKIATATSCPAIPQTRTLRWATIPCGVPLPEAGPPFAASHQCQS